MRKTTFVITAVFGAILLTGGAPATQGPTQQPAVDIRAAYTKSEHLVPMRDGVKLFTIF